ncbi:MAG: ribosomal-protein-alanine N-acetyltransferase [bacterium]|nr:ribosomal-protein-alanine N-acetyltransferase [bacterium]
MIEIVDCTAADLDAICEIEKLSFGDPWPRKVFQEELKPRGFNFARLAKSKEEGRLAGFCLFFVFPQHEAQITNIAVHPDFRRRGVAKQLLFDALNFCREREAESVFLEVRPSNESARAFYKAMGFIQVGRRKNYYDDPREDALLLRYELTLSDESTHG